MKWSGRGKAFQVVNSKEKGETLPNVGGCVQQEGRHAQDQKRKQPEATWEDRTSPPASRSLARALRHMALPLRHCCSQENGSEVGGGQQPFPMLVIV